MKAWKPKTIGIIGGKGLMGSFFAKFFRKHGFRVLISDLLTPLSNKKVVQLSEVIIVSVPINVTEKVIREILPVLKKNQLLTDVTSLKVFPVKEMMKGKATVIGLHPMFRPGPSGMKGQTIVMCAMSAPARQKTWLKKLFEKAGAIVPQMSPQKHDHLMAIVQVLVHFHSLVFGETLRKLRANLGELMKVMSPIYRLQFDVVCRIFAQNPLLYASIGMENPEMRKVTNAFLKETRSLHRIFKTKNSSTFLKNFKKTVSFLGPFSKQALKESDAVIMSLPSR